jgi:hypothetical protein
LTFTEPPTQRIGVHEVQSVEDGERADTSPDCEGRGAVSFFVIESTPHPPALTIRCMTLRSRDHPESSIKVPTSAQEIDRLVEIQRVQSSEERKGRDCAVGEARSNLSPFVACKAAVGSLEGEDVWEGRGPGSAKAGLRETAKGPTGDDLVLVQEVEGVLHGENLDGAESGVDVWVMAWVGCEGAWSKRTAKVGA